MAAVASPVIECVPNVSEGRDARVIDRLADAVRATPGVRLADVHADRDHHRSVLTLLGAPDAVERAALALARAVFASVDMRRHRCAHPRIGALDVVPFAPLRGLTMPEAAARPRAFGLALAREQRVPVYFP